MTYLDTEKAEDRGIVHRDYIAHAFRWSYVLKHMKFGQEIADIGCGTGALAQVLYVNKYKPKHYYAVNINKKQLEKVVERKVNFPIIPIHCDLRKDTIEIVNDSIDVATCFEVLEHFQPYNLDFTLQEISRILKPDGKLLLSTPNFNGQKAGNHIHEYTEQELRPYLEKYFIIENQFGTFASKRDIYPNLTTTEKEVYDKLTQYYDSNIMSVFLAPLYPSASRNILWVLKK